MMALLLGIAPLLFAGSAQDARWEVSPEQVVIGEPVLWHLTVEHFADEVVEGVPDEPAGEDEGWLLLEGPTHARVRLPEGRTRSEYTWRYLALEPGALEVPELMLQLDRDHMVGVPPAQVTVAGELAEDEDAPRPLPPLPGSPAAPASPLPWVLGAGAVLLLGAGLIVRANRAPKRPQPEPELGPAARLAALEPEGARSPAEAAAFAHEVTGALRAAVDETLQASGAHLVDGEWVGALRESGRMPAGWTDRLADLLARCEEVKYGRVTPTTMGLADLRELARGLHEQLASAVGGEVAA